MSSAIYLCCQNCNQYTTSQIEMHSLSGCFVSPRCSISELKVHNPLKLTCFRWAPDIPKGGAGSRTAMLSGIPDRWYGSIMET